MEQAGGLEALGDHQGLFFGLRPLVQDTGLQVTIAVSCRLLEGCFQGSFSPVC